MKKTHVILILALYVLTNLPPFGGMQWRKKIIRQRRRANIRWMFEPVFVLCLAIGVFVGEQAACQDIHFSQFTQTPLLVNPALTGNFNGDQRVILNYKNQWQTVGSPYKTFAFSADAGWFKKKWKNAYIGTGLNVFTDKAGDFNLGITQYNVSLSGVVSVSEHNRIAAGMQGGIAQRSIGNSNMIWDSQISGITYDPSLPSGEAGSYPSFKYPDISSGIMWNYGSEESSIFNNNMLGFYAGVALYHINRPQQKFYATDRLNRKFVALAGGRIGLEESNISLVPSFIYMQQGPAQEINAGLLCRYTLQESSKYTGHYQEMALSIGGSYRAKDAIIPSILYEYANYALGITYDVNVSKLRDVSQAKGGIEISLRYINPNPFKVGASKSVRFL